jgi:hypothetical protein
MTFNPYITQHYGSSMELLSTRLEGDNGNEDVVDAAVGFRRFPNAAHMTHTVFKPKNAATSSVAPSNSAKDGAKGSARADVSDVLASLRLHRGVPLDNFPSRPLTPKGNSSAASLPPLLPTDRSSAGSTDSLRDRGAGLLRNWVKAAVATSSSSSSPSPSSSSSSSSTKQAVTTSATKLASKEEAKTRADVTNATRDFGKAGVRASPPRLPVTAAALPKPIPPPAEPAALSVSISPVSPHLGSNAQTTSTNETPVLTPEPEKEREGEGKGNVGLDGVMSQMLRRSRETLESVQRVLGDAPESVTTTNHSAGESLGRPLAPPPPLAPKGKVEVEVEVEEGGSNDVALRDVPAAMVEVAACASSQQRSPEDSLGYLSPLSANHNEALRFPPSAATVGGDGTAVLGDLRVAALHTSVHLSETAALPNTTRFMVLCTVADPAAMVDQRMRRRNPNTQRLPPQHGVKGATSASVSHICESRVLNDAAAVRPEAQLSPVRKSSEVRYSTTARSLASGSSGKGQEPQLNDAPSSANSSVVTAHTLTQAFRKSPPCQSAAQSTPPAKPASAKQGEGPPHPLLPPPPRSTLHEDPSLLQELAEFLRAGNASGFSNLSAALAAPTTNTAVAAASSSATLHGTGGLIRSRRNPRAPSRPRVAAATAAAPPPPAATVSIDSPVAATAPSLSPFVRSFTTSSQLARVNTHDAHQVEAAGPSVSPHRTTVRTHRSCTLPSYAQPTISWLSKGSEASADDFPVTHAASELTSSSNEAKAAS